MARKEGGRLLGLRREVGNTKYSKRTNSEAVSRAIGSPAKIMGALGFWHF
jgi:hypothetical protein